MIVIQDATANTPDGAKPVDVKAIFGTSDLTLHIGDAVYTLPYDMRFLHSCASEYVARCETVTQAVRGGK